MIVEEGPPVKKRVVHDASHEGAISRRQRETLSSAKAPGGQDGPDGGDRRHIQIAFLGCMASSRDTFVYLNCVGTFGLASAGYWWAKISGGSIRLVPQLTGRRALEIPLFADDVEMIGGDKRGRRGIVLSYALLACLGFPFKHEWMMYLSQAAPIPL